MWVLLLLTAYGICFGLQHKLGFLHKKYLWLDELLACSYCTGFHAGWLVFILSVIGNEFASTMISEGIVFAFASAAFSYFMDTFTAYLEKL